MLNFSHSLEEKDEVELTDGELATVNGAHGWGGWHRGWGGPGWGWGGYYGVPVAEPVPVGVPYGVGYGAPAGYGVGYGAPAGYGGSNNKPAVIVVSTSPSSSTPTVQTV